MKLPTYERAAPYVAGVLLALPVLIARYPPMTDLPLHEAIVSILRNFDDAEMFPRGLYLHNLGQPNQLFHMAAWGLSYAVATDVACKIVVALSVVAILAAGARFAKHVGASPLGALAIAPVALGWTFFWGLVANLLGIAALLFVLPWLDEHAEAPTGKTLAKNLFGIVLLYFAHEQILLVYAGAALLFAVVHPLSLKKTALRLVPILATAAVVVGQAEYQKHLVTPLVAARAIEFASLSYKLEHVPDMLIHMMDAVVATLFLAFAVAAIAALYALRWKERKGAPGSRLPPLGISWAGALRPRLHRYRFELLALGCLALYFIFPFALNGATLVYHRFFAPAFCIGALVAAPRDLSVPRARLVRLLAPALPLGVLFVTWSQFVDSDRGFRRLEPLLAMIGKGSAVATLDLSQGRRERDFSMSSLTTRVVAERGGRILYGFTDSPIAACVVSPEYQWQEVVIRTFNESLAFRPEHDFTRFRYLIFRSTEPWVLDVVTEALDPYARLVMRDDEVTLKSGEVIHGCDRPLASAEGAGHRPAGDRRGAHHRVVGARRRLAWRVGALRVEAPHRLAAHPRRAHRDKRRGTRADARRLRPVAPGTDAQGARSPARARARDSRRVTREVRRREPRPLGYRCSVDRSARYPPPPEDADVYVEHYHVRRARLRVLGVVVVVAAVAGLLYGAGRLHAAAGKRRALDALRRADELAREGDARGAPMADVPGGTYRIGSDTSSEEEAPAHDVTLGPFAIDETEVTVAAYRFCVMRGACTLPNEGLHCTYVARMDEHPVNWCDLRSGRDLLRVGEEAPPERGRVGGCGARGPRAALSLGRRSPHASPRQPLRQELRRGLSRERRTSHDVPGERRVGRDLAGAELLAGGRQPLRPLGHDRQRLGVDSEPLLRVRGEVLSLRHAGHSRRIVLELRPQQRDDDRALRARPLARRRDHRLPVRARHRGGSQGARRMSDENESSNAKAKEAPMRGFSAMDVQRVKEIARGGARKAAQLAARPRAQTDGEEEEQEEDAGHPAAAKPEEKPPSRERTKK